MGRTLNRVAGVVSAAALATFAAAPVALAQETDTTAPETTTTTSTSETSSTTTTVPATTTTTESSPVTTTSTTSAPSTTDVTKTTVPETETSTTTPPDDNFPDNTGHGFVGLGGEGVLVINCAAGHVGNVATQYLSVTGGPDQDESDGRIWNYTVRVENLPAGTTTGKFSWTCDGVEGEGIVEFQQEEPPASSSAPASSTAPVTTATSSTTATITPVGNAAPKAQVKVAPKGGVETGFGGTAW
ncbi:hypothetical protein SAMN05421837_10590 [Amycolatopsis pretoriensis]|uniref:Secreted protein n=1 Tax=Amycolatopsis pretoriensis TaxID=218821 RepID=A0A1H5QVW4_9PSEU|nr:hypothetical protein [Amycolatopsis pretoriensis]SEF30233.1 hypothetical protein SAMN05421837_10590 [Amycolatopsis pretoriensis]